MREPLARATCAALLPIAAALDDAALEDDARGIHDVCAALLALDEVAARGEREDPAFVVTALQASLNALVAVEVWLTARFPDGAGGRTLADLRAPVDRLVRRTILEIVDRVH